ncbi:putative aspartic proteinase CDR1-like [Capsicum annuum]|uniref:aspartic proteinase CDR1-like n=1 Tax=Capsicum annuum TaxID=4072 RepID=UPI001FB19958|nr:aspartic proteinase CDR1-like [Capsicum annuum]KAF3637156.1 putative aspartic proteinase CDR1-like [Capsicum annuum]KAF3649188.1 putative aspartic proteinase CDR1-like [Capsicum annuum]
MLINTKYFTFIPKLVLLSFFYPSLVCYRKSVNGFTVDVIHRDSPLSPFYNPSITPYELLQNAFHQSFSRASSFRKNSIKSIQSTVNPTGSAFLMKISVGTPPVDILATVDTGSDLTWLQCEPCVHCFQQTGTPIFNPKNSSTYFTVDCENLYCQDLAPITCRDDICNYEQGYSDKSYSRGELAIETFSFTSTSGENVAIPLTFFGCGHDNAGNFPTGVVGLGRGDISIVNQMNDDIKGKFSYCLIPFDASKTNDKLTSHINFGDSAVVSGPGVVSTHMTRKESQKSFYYLFLESISIGEKNLPFKSTKIFPPGQANIIIDSGTTLTLVPSDFYLNLEEAVVASISATRVNDPAGTFKVCYASDIVTINAPRIVAHFTNADVELSPENSFIQFGPGVICLAIVPSDDLFIFGNLAQLNYLIGYDLVANQVSFLPTDCSQH